MSYDLDSIQLNRAYYLLRKSKRILICGHAQPDADCLGSALALKLALNSIWKKSLSISLESLPQNLQFLPGINQVETGSQIKRIDKYDLIVSLDSSNLERTGLFKGSEIVNSKPIINIDHHPDNSFFGSINIVKPKSSSVAEILYDFFLKFKIKITKDIATCLLAGIFFDTDAFRNPNTTSHTLKITSTLLLKGARIRKIVKYLLKERSLDTLRLWGKALARLKENKYGLVLTVISENDFKPDKIKKEDLEGIANFLNCFPQAKATLLLSEKEGKIHGSLRTQRDDIDVSKLASLFGGGGHRKAAGFTISGKLSKTGKGWKIV